MKRRMSLFVLGLLLFSASPASAQVCHWCKRGGKDIKWVKLFWYKYDKESKPPKLIDLREESKYKQYRLKDAKKRHVPDPIILQSAVPELYDGSGDLPEADAHYWLCYYHFDGKKSGDGGESGITLSTGREFEKGEPCAAHNDDGKPCERFGFRNFEKVRGGKLRDALWYCPVHFAAASEQKKKMPMFIFGGVALVLLICVALGLLGIKIGDKERALDESGGDGGRKRR